jgi:cell division protein FtsB
MSKRYKKNYSIDGWPIEDYKNKVVLHTDDLVEILNSLETERDALQSRIKQLEAELEEERQENASLRSGDDYLRGAE